MWPEHSTMTLGTIVPVLVTGICQHKVQKKIIVVKFGLWKNMLLNSIYLKNTLIYKFSLKICYEDIQALCFRINYTNYTIQKFFSSPYSPPSHPWMVVDNLYKLWSFFNVSSEGPSSGTSQARVSILPLPSQTRSSRDPGTGWSCDQWHDTPRSGVS